MLNNIKKNQSEVGQKLIVAPKIWNVELHCYLIDLLWKGYSRGGGGGEYGLKLCGANEIIRKKS